jgi:hypothetical protein
MNADACCQGAARAAGRSPPLGGSGRRAAGWAGRVASGAALVLVPKCPVCVATYVALFTGVGISVQTAAHLRSALLALGGASLVGLSTGGLWRVAVRWSGRLKDHAG